MRVKKKDQFDRSKEANRGDILQAANLMRVVPVIYSCTNYLIETDQLDHQMSVKVMINGHHTD